VTRVAVLGTGRMGSAMARALRAAGHELILYNRTLATARDLADSLGATVAAEPRGAVADAHVAITMLADGAAVEETYVRPGGILDGAHDGLVLLDMSTVEPRVSRTLEPRVRERGAALLDAPVSGSTALAEGGKLTIMVGGDGAALDRARPVLDALAARVFHLGPVGNGAAMKLAVNAVIFGLDVALAEALVMAERAGVERSAAWDVLEASAVGAPFVGYKRAAFLDPAATPVAFALDLAAKDLRLIAGLAEETGVPTAQARTNLEVILAAAGSVGGERDFAEVAEHLRRRRPVAAGGGEGSSG
jgi:3-hydroxyisobutyrate dehydrogenase-like beta-hydroxyacid dehydrogenase